MKCATNKVNRVQQTLFLAMSQQDKISASQEQNTSAESQKPRQRVSNADRKVFAISLLLVEEFPEMSGYYTKYPDNMQSVRII